MLLSMIAEGLGCDMDEYELPGERIRQWLTETPAGLPADPEVRRLQVLAAVETGLGDLG